MKCQAHVNSGSCWREATQEMNGRHLCNVHAAARRRSSAQREASDAKWKETRARDKALQERAKALSQKLGIPVGVEYYIKGYVERATVPFDWLERIAATLP